MDLQLVRDRSKEFPAVSEPASITTAQIWHCNYRTLAPLAALTNLRSLDIATYPDDSLQVLAPLRALEELRIVHLPNVTDLEPLRSLAGLRHLSLATLPSWDASGRRQEVSSLAPIGSLPLLEELELFGVVPADRAVDALLASTSLRRVRVSKYPKPQVARLRAAGLQDGVGTVVIYKQGATSAESA